MLPLTPGKARIFRITHVANVPWLLRHGVPCRSSGLHDPGFHNIGNPELIEKRTTWKVPVPPGGTLSDYVPFYFTSRSPMLFNIKTGRNVPAVSMRDIVIFVTSLPYLREHGVPFLFTDRHACLIPARFSSDLANLDWIDWDILSRGDFRRDPEDPGKIDRYQAEALVYGSVPITAITGIICYNEARRVHLEELVTQAGHAAKVVARPEYFF